MENQIIMKKLIITAAVIISTAFIGSCEKTDPTKKISSLKNCNKIEFVYRDKKGMEPGTVFAEITDKETIQNIQTEMKELEPCMTEGLLMFQVMRAKNNRTEVYADVCWNDDKKVVLFRNYKSKKLFEILWDCGIIKPVSSRPTLPPFPDVDMDKEKERMDEMIKKLETFKPTE